ncbi:MAG: RNA-binding S4 domain-containing protein [Bacteroidetes bacterium]|nr:RNA-binding S4 domain-containing protein [Bacteroidota bacterium]
MEYKIKGEYIELMALLKIVGIADSGGQAGMLITEGYIKRNGEPEFRKRAKLKPGDVIQFEDKKITIGGGINDGLKKSD